MIPKKEFYFIRHGQTDYNLSKRPKKEDCPNDIPLNATGIEQAQFVAPIIASLPIKTVCSSPLRRAQETKEIITESLMVDHHAIDDLGECNLQIWNEMMQFRKYCTLPTDGHARVFIDRVCRGITKALSLPGPHLIVAHGGVHWALCCLMGIAEYQWLTDNCVPIHFSINEEGNWVGKKMVSYEWSRP